MFCENCGRQNEPGAAFCVGCGKKLAVQVTVNDGGVLFPRNTAAVTAYYLGVASVLCCVFTGVPALILGIVGLRKAKEDPSLKGEVHAWVGIVLGALSIALPLIAAIVARILK